VIKRIARHYAGSVGLSQKQVLTAAWCTRALVYRALVYRALVYELA